MKLILLLFSFVVFANDPNTTEKILSMKGAKDIGIKCFNVFADSSHRAHLQLKIKEDQKDQLLSEVQKILRATDARRTAETRGKFEKFMSVITDAQLFTWKLLNGHEYPHKYRVTGVVQAARLYAIHGENAPKEAKDIVNNVIRQFESFHATRAETVWNVVLNRFTYEQAQRYRRTKKGHQSIKTMNKGSKEQSEKAIKLTYPRTYDLDNDEIIMHTILLNDDDELMEEIYALRTKDPTHFDGIPIGRKIVNLPFTWRYSNRDYLAPDYAQHATLFESLRIIRSELRDLHTIKDENDERTIKLRKIQKLLSVDGDLMPSKHSLSMEAKDASRHEIKWFEGHGKELEEKARRLEPYLDPKDKKNLGLSNADVTGLGRVVRMTIAHIPTIVTSLVAGVATYFYFDDIKQQIKIVFFEEDIKREIGHMLDEKKYAQELCAFLEMKYNQVDCLGDMTSSMRGDVDEIQSIHFYRRIKLMMNELGGKKLSQRLSKDEEKLIDEFDAFNTAKTLLFKKLSNHQSVDDIARYFSLSESDEKQAIFDSISEELTRQDKDLLKHLDTIKRNSSYDDD